MRLFALTLLSLLAAPASAAAAMSFEVVTLGVGHCRDRCPQVIFAQGEIDNGSAQNFLDFVRQSLPSGELHGIVLLDSPGGHVVAAMELGQTIRRLGMAIIVARPGDSGGMAQLYSGRCYSACVYALMGGKKRVVPPQSRVGVHRMFNYSTNFSLADGGFVNERYLDDGEMRGRLSRYSQAMGVSPAVIDLAEHTAPDYLRVLTPGEIARWRLAAQKF